MKIFDCSELQRGMIFHIQDRDRGFVFIGRMRFYGLDFIQFDVLPIKEQPSCKTLGMYTFDIGSKFTLHGVKWNDEQKEYVYDESIITSEYLEKDAEEKYMKSDVKKDKKKKDIKFDVKKVEDLLYDSVWHIQDHDNKFQFNGTFKSVKPDELTFYICGPTVGSKIRGTYTLPVGSQFTLYKMRRDADNKEWTFAGNNLTFKDIAKNDNDDNKEEKDMKPNFWKDCVIKENAWVVNDQIKEGDTIYRIKTDSIDIRGKMTIGNTCYYMMYVEFTNSGESTDCINIEITPDMKVFKTDSTDDSGILVQQQKCKFNPELRVGKLYWITNSDLEFKYVMHVKSITNDSIDVHIINTIKELDNRSSLTVTGKSFDIKELLEFIFKEV